MIKKLLILAAVFFSSISFAKTDIKELQKSIFKIVLYTKEGPVVATAFVVNQGKKTVLVTNNHVCDEFHKSNIAVLIPTNTMPEIPRNHSKIEEMDLDRITEYYLHPGSDICIAKSENLKYLKGLDVADLEIEPTDDVLVSGFVGRSLDLMYVEGKVYGTVKIQHPVKLNNCITSPPKNKEMAPIFTCSLFGVYPSYIDKMLFTAVNNTGPGFSGSPVLKDGVVVGIVSRYFAPRSGYSNGDVIFFPSKDIKEAITQSKGKMVGFNSDFFKDWIQITQFDEEARTLIEDFQEDMTDLKREFLNKKHE